MSDLAQQPDNAEPNGPAGPAAPVPPVTPPRVRGRKRRAMKRGTRWVVVALAATIATVLFTLFTVDIGKISIGGKSLRTLAEGYASKYLLRDMTIGSISAYVTPGKFAFHDVTIKGPFTDTRPFFHADTITVEFPWWTLFTKERNVEVHIRGWRMVVERFADGKTHMPKLTPESKGPSNPSSFKWRTLSVYAHDGEFVYDDHVMPWSVHGPNLNFSVVRDNILSTYVGSAEFTNGLVQIQQFEPMHTSLRTRFQIDGGIVRLRHIDLLTDGAETHLDGYVNFKSFPEQEYNIQSTVDFDRMRRLFWNKATWRVSGQGDFKGIFKVTQQGAIDLSGHFASDEAGLGIGNAEWRFPDLHGNLQWTNGRFIVPSADSDFLGGQLRLTYALEGIGTAGGAFASLAADYNDVDAYRFTRQFGMTALEPQGRMHGRMSMGWRNGWFGDTMVGSGTTSIRAAGGAIATSELSPAATPIPAEADFQARRAYGMFAIGGETSYKFTASSLDFDPSWVATPATYVKFNGHAIGGPANVAFHVTSHDWQRSDRLFAAIMANYGHPVDAIDVGGQGTFDGSLTKSFKAPHIEGQFTADNMRAWGQLWGHANGHIAIEDGYLTVTDGRVDYKDGGRILTTGKYSLGYRSDGSEEWNTHIRAEDMPLLPLREAFGMHDWPLDGKLTLADLNLTGAYGKPGGGGTMKLEQAVAWKEPIDSATGTLAFEGNGSVRLTSIEILKGPGKVTGNALLSWATDSFLMVANGSDLPVDSLQNFRLEKTPLSGVLTFQARGEGSYDAPIWHIDAHVPDLYVADEGIGAVHGVLTVADNSLKGDVTAGSGVTDRLDASCSGSMALVGDYLSNVNCRFTRTSIDPYFKFFVGDMPFTKAIISGAVTLAGPLTDTKKLSVDARIDDAALTLFNYALGNDGPLQFGLRNNRVELDHVWFAGDKTKLKLTGNVDLTTRTANVKADGDANLAVLQAFYPQIGTEGTATLAATLTGGFDNLAMSGRADITDGRLKPFDFPQSLEGINGPITMEAGRISVDGLHAVVGEGTVDFSGGILLNGYKPEQFALTAKGYSMHLRIPEGLQSTVDATLDLHGPVTSPTLSGRVDVLRANYAPKLSDPTLGYFGLLRNTVDTSTALPKPVDESASTFPIALAIKVQGAHVAVIEDKGTNTLIEASADVDITGQIDRPIVTGRVDLDRGEWLFNGNRYHLESGTVDFSNPAKFDPYFDMTFETDARSLGQRYTVTVRVTGTLGKLSASLSSEPGLPEFQIISLLLGETTRLEDAERLARTDPLALQTQAIESVAFTLLTSPVSATVGSAVQRVTTLTAQIVPVLYGNEANLQQVNPSARIVLGRPISDRIYLSWSHSLSGSQNDVVLVQFDQSDQISWVLSRNEDRSFALDLRLRRLIK